MNRVYMEYESPIFEGDRILFVCTMYIYIYLFIKDVANVYFPVFMYANIYFQYLQMFIFLLLSNPSRQHSKVLQYISGKLGEERDRKIWKSRNDQKVVGSIVGGGQRPRARVIFGDCIWNAPVVSFILSTFDDFGSLGSPLRQVVYPPG